MWEAGSGKVNSKEADEHLGQDFVQLLSTSTTGAVVRIFQAVISP